MNGKDQPPGYWMNESSGVLRPAVEAYLDGARMTEQQIVVMRAYLRQWIVRDCWQGGAALDALRISLNAIRTQEDIEHWLTAAERIGIDPI